MKSIKPGRGPSMMGGVVGIFMVGFGIFWTVMAARFSGFFALFGVLWTCIAIANTVYNFKNATKKNRYSAYDIVDSSEEPDPWNQRFVSQEADHAHGGQHRFCPYCGTAVEEDFAYCGKCGKKLPKS